MPRAPLLLVALLACSAWSLPPAAAQDAPEDPAHAELRSLKDGLVESVNAGDLDKLLSYLHGDVIVTWLDGTQSRGHDQVAEYYRSKVEGENAIVESFSVEPEVKELSFLYGDDTAIAYGDATSHFLLRGGQSLNVHGPWSATMVKDGDRWVIAAFHSSAGIFDNPMLNAALQFAYWGIAIAAVVGLLLGIVLALVARKLRSRKPMAAA